LLPSLRVLLLKPCRLELCGAEGPAFAAAAASVCAAGAATAPCCCWRLRGVPTLAALLTLPVVSVSLPPLLPVPLYPLSACSSSLLCSSPHACTCSGCGGVHRCRH
jgi:hypothetical protein